jgi:hypothetical protein
MCFRKPQQLETNIGPVHFNHCTAQDRTQGRLIGLNNSYLCYTESDWIRPMR